jgi:hypothetical protein
LTREETHNRELKGRERRQRPDDEDDRERTRNEHDAVDVRVREDGDPRDIQREGPDHKAKRRHERAENLGGQELERGDGRRQQGLERARLLFADHGVGRHGHGAGNRRQHEQQQELLEDPGLDRSFRVERSRPGLGSVHLDRDLEVARVREPLAGDIRNDHRDKEGEHDRQGSRDDGRHEDGGVAPEVGQLLREQGADARHVRRSPSSSLRYTSSSDGSSGTTD